MYEDQTLDNPNKISELNLFEVITIGFLFCSSLGFFEWILFRGFQDVFIAIEFEPLTVLWLTNIATTILNLILVFAIFSRVQKKLIAKTLDWKKMLAQSKYVFTITILLNIFFQVYWDSMLPDSFFILSDLFFIESLDSLIFTTLSIVFTGIDVVLIVFMLKRFSDEMMERSGKT